MPSRRRSKQMKKITGKLDYMPAELMEKILLNLPVKSLFRFSTASKLWNSIIFGPEFAQSYRGRDMIVFKSFRLNDSGFYKSLLACPLSSMLSDNLKDGTTPFDIPPGLLLASCGYLWLWCVKFEKSLLLYNPSIQTYRKLPNPVSADDDDYSVYGLGYDSVCDDYKILKIFKTRKRSGRRYDEYDVETTEAEMYSLRSDCWRKVESQIPEFTYFVSEKGLFVSGKIHWLVTQLLRIEYGGEPIDYKFILSFDLSEEKFGLIELPELLPKQSVFRSQLLDMIVFGGKLRVYHSCKLKNNDSRHFSVWVMEDYESKLWMKEMEIDYSHMTQLRSTFLRPFYFYDLVGNLVRAVTNFISAENIFIYKEEDGSSSTPTLVEQNLGINGYNVVGSWTYVESIVSPLTWHGSSTKADDDDDGSSRKMRS